MIQDLDFNSIVPLVTEHVTDPRRLAQIAATLDQAELGKTLVIALDGNDTIVRWVDDLLELRGHVPGLLGGQVVA